MMVTKPPRTDSFVSLPVGSVITWCGSTGAIPDGWLYCNGTIMQQSEHPDLYKVIGQSFGHCGSKFDPNTQFYIPDFRGFFLRGVDDGSGRDPDTDERCDLHDEHLKYSGLGSAEKDQFRSHTHTYDHFPASRGDIGSGRYWKSDGAQTEAAGGKETRPINIAVYFLIRSKP